MELLRIPKQEPVLTAARAVTYLTAGFTPRDCQVNALVAQYVMGWKPSNLLEGFPPQNEVAVKFQDYAKDIRAVWEVRAKVNTWPFSRRMLFSARLQQVVSKRMKLAKEKLIGTEYILLKVEPIDICIAALMVALTNSSEKPAKKS